MTPRRARRSLPSHLYRARLAPPGADWPAALLALLLALVVARAAGQQARRLALHEGEEVVEVVGHAGGELADGLHLLLLA